LSVVHISRNSSLLPDVFAFANYILPLQIGAPDCGVPRSDRQGRARSTTEPAPVVSKLDVARGASQQPSADLQEFPPMVSCPNDLPAQVGAVEDCALTDFTRHDRHLATVRIDRIGGRAPHYVVTVGAATLPPPGD